MKKLLLCVHKRNKKQQLSR